MLKNKHQEEVAGIVEASSDMLEKTQEQIGKFKKSQTTVFGYTPGAAQTAASTSSSGANAVEMAGKKEQEKKQNTEIIFGALGKANSQMGLFKYELGLNEKLENVSHLTLGSGGVNNEGNVASNTEANMQNSG